MQAGATMSTHNQSAEEPLVVVVAVEVRVRFPLSRHAPLFYLVNLFCVASLSIKHFTASACTAAEKTALVIRIVFVRVIFNLP